MTGKQSPDAPVGSSWLQGSGSGHGEIPLSNRARLLSPAVLYNDTIVASLVTRLIPQMSDI
jgi:hypothetical protein